jgi:RNA recognition motif-containing protein
LTFYNNISEPKTPSGYVPAMPANVMVFKTNISNPVHRIEVIAVLKKIGTVSECWVDIEDCDRVLRIVGTVPQSHIEETVRSMGFAIKELED